MELLRGFSPSLATSNLEFVSGLRKGWRVSRSAPSTDDWFTTSFYHKLIPFAAGLERTVSDDFRIIQLYITTVNKPAPVHLHGLFGSARPHAAGGDEEASINPALLGREG